MSPEFLQASPGFTPENIHALLLVLETLSVFLRNSPSKSHLVSFSVSIIFPVPQSPAVSQQPPAPRMRGPVPHAHIGDSKYNEARVNLGLDFRTNCINGSLAKRCNPSHKSPGLHSHAGYSKASETPSRPCGTSQPLASSSEPFECSTASHAPSKVRSSWMQWLVV